MASIKRIVLKNFRNYKESEIDLNDGAGVFFIYGNNGGGKTTLLNAINWCLYGDIVFHGVDTDLRVKPSWAAENDLTEVSLIIEDDGRQYAFRRTTSGFNNTGTLTAREIDGNGNSGDLQPFERDAIIKRVLPGNIKNLFFLSENFSNDILGQGSTNSLKANVYKVSELDTINSALRHLEATRDYYVKNISKATKDYGRIQKLNEDVSFCEKKVHENEAEIELAISKIAKHKASLAELEEILRNSKQVRELLEQRKVWKRQLKDVENDLANDEADITDCVQENYYKVLLLDGIEKYKVALNDARERGTIPAPINPKIMQQSKDRGVCACCGKALDEEARNFMDEQQRKYENIDKRKFLVDGINEFADIKKQIGDVWDVLRDALESKGKNEEKCKEIDAQLEKISEKLNGVDEANLPDNPEERRKELERKVERWERRRREYADNIVELKQQKEKSQGDLARLMNSAGGDVGSLQKELDRIENLKELLARLKEEAEGIIRERIREGVWQSFKQIMPDTQFDSILINDDYIFRFVDRNGFETEVSSLSIGEAKTLALSLVSTLSNDIGYSDTPLFIDNLFHGIEASHFIDVTKCVESLADKKQIFITYLHSDKTDEGNRVSKNFNPTVIRQEIGAIKDLETGICNIWENK